MKKKCNNRLKNVFYPFWNIFFCERWYKEYKFSFLIEFGSKSNHFKIFPHNRNSEVQITWDGIFLLVNVFFTPAQSCSSGKIV